MILDARWEQRHRSWPGTPGELFDPRWHEAITTEMRADVPEGTILQVAQPGYALGERVIRPAQVVVAHAPSAISEVQGQHVPEEEDRAYAELAMEYLWRMYRSAYQRALAREGLGQ